MPLTTLPFAHDGDRPPRHRPSAPPPPTRTPPTVAWDPDRRPALALPAGRPQLSAATRRLALPQRRFVDLPPAHTALICVALPGLVISTDQGQLTGRGLEGFYRAGRRTLSAAKCGWRGGSRSPYRPG